MAEVEGEKPNSDVGVIAREYEASWQAIDWEKAERRLQEYQGSLARLTYAARMGKVTKLQRKMVTDPDMKALAIKQVSGTLRPFSIDHSHWESDAQKGAALAVLNEGVYQASPCYTFSAMQDGKERTYSLPRLYDRAMQKLYSFALAPVMESLADKKSFAFRKGRSSLDAHVYLCKMLQQNEAGWVVVTDVKSYYNTISHRWLLDNIPMDRHILHEFLGAGQIMNGSLFPSDQGISLGFVISPILGNMVLDGLQKRIFDDLHTESSCKDYTQGNMLRFADDIVVTTHTYDDAVRVLGIIRDFASERGLRLSADKTRICHVNQGFDLLSRTYQMKNGNIVAFPSEEAVRSMENELEAVILLHRGSQRRLIERVNRKLAGWAAYHRIADGYDAFCHIDNVVQAYLVKLCQSLHPAMPLQKVIAKYWFKDAHGEYVYALRNAHEVRIMKLADTLPVKHDAVSITKNPYLDIEYFAEREQGKEVRKVSGRYKALWKRQAGKCFYCGNDILPDQDRCLVVVDPTKDETLKNHAYVHAVCKAGFSGIGLPATATHQACAVGAAAAGGGLSLPEGENAQAVLEDVCAREAASADGKYSPLADYLHLKTKLFITLKFAEVEDIIHDELPPSAFTSRTFWQKQGFSTISESWLSQGYSLHSVHLDKKTVVLKRTEKNMSGLNIPRVFLTTKIPDDAKLELEEFFKHIQQKYGL